MNKGIILILMGYITWGLFPIYWALLKNVPATEVLAHRMLWSVPVLILVVAAVRTWRSDFISAIKDKKELLWLFITAMLITINWGTYILAVNYDRVVEASMGYFLTPLLHILGGFIIFKERISRLKQLAVLFAVLGVSYYIASVDKFPWMGLVLGVSFAGYGILRKKIKTSAVSGLLVETLLLMPLAVGYIACLMFSKSAAFTTVSLETDIWLLLAGIVTVVPLVLFTSGARLLPMTTTGILFYITPTIQFLVGILLFKEKVNIHQLTGFVGIWIGLSLYTYSLVSTHKK